MKMNRFKKNKDKKIIGQRGSALVLTVIVLVSALTIVTAISAISVLERKMSSRTKNSVPAFQAADSGVEWALYKIEQEDPMTQTLSGTFNPEGISMNAQGRYQCPAGIDVTCEFYFVNRSGEIIKDDSTVLVDIDSVRVVGKYGAIEEEATRAIEAVLELVNCPSGFIPVSDFCVMETDLGASMDSWVNVAQKCVEEYDARLCTAAEWVVSCELNEPGGALEGRISGLLDGREWVDDVTDGGEFLVFGNSNCTNASSQSAGVSQGRCCVNLKQ